MSVVESMGDIIPRTSQLNLGVRLSPHPASDVLSLRFCSCGYNRENSHELLLDYSFSSWHDFRRYRFCITGLEESAMRNTSPVGVTWIPVASMMGVTGSFEF
jgi:hypothetical protein